MGEEEKGIYLQSHCLFLGTDTPRAPQIHQEHSSAVPVTNAGDRKGCAPSKTLLPFLKVFGKARLRHLPSLCLAFSLALAKPGLPVKNNQITSSECSEPQEGRTVYTYEQAQLFSQDSISLFAFPSPGNSCLAP